MSSASVYMVATEFSPYPAGRYMAHGPNSGERLRGEIQHLLSLHDVVGVDFSGCLGQSPSFLDEAFRGLPAARVYTLNLSPDYRAVCEEAMQ